MCVSGEKEGKWWKDEKRKHPYADSQATVQSKRVDEQRNKSQSMFRQCSDMNMMPNRQDSTPR